MIPDNLILFFATVFPNIPIEVLALSGSPLTFLRFFQKLKFTINKFSSQYDSYFARKEVSQGTYLDIQAEQRATNKKLDRLNKVLAIFLVIGFVIGIVLILRSINKKD
ncbi:MAG TPA: hypothetical protein VF360_05740 [Candidatus Methanoperedens sp.]